MQVGFFVWTGGVETALASGSRTWRRTSSRAVRSCVVSSFGFGLNAAKIAKMSKSSLGSLKAFGLRLDSSPMLMRSMKRA